MFSIGDICHECKEENRKMFLAEAGNYDDNFEDCYVCGGCGEIPHDCGEDTCCCLNPEDEICNNCDGDGRISSWIKK